MKPYIVTLKDLNVRKELNISLEASEIERMALKKEMNFLNVHYLKGDFKVFLASSGKGIGVEGEVKAKIMQACSVTLEPVLEEFTEIVKLRYVPENEMPEDLMDDEGNIIIDWSQPFEIELLQNKQIDVAVIVEEYFILGINPYPRSKEAETITSKNVNLLSDTQEKVSTHKPFANLLKFKKDEEPS
jgi:uncharacterized metal-binding protein YceD (DUF177 family)